jgi:hypothetical protein
MGHGLVRSLHHVRELLDFVVRPALTCVVCINEVPWARVVTPSIGLGMCRGQLEDLEEAFIRKPATYFFGLVRVEKLRSRQGT